MLLTHYPNYFNYRKFGHSLALIKAGGFSQCILDALSDDQLDTLDVLRAPGETVRERFKPGIVQRPDDQDLFVAVFVWRREIS